MCTEAPGPGSWGACHALARLGRGVVQSWGSMAFLPCLPLLRGLQSYSTGFPSLSCTRWRPCSGQGDMGEIPWEDLLNRKERLPRRTLLLSLLVPFFLSGLWRDAGGDKHKFEGLCTKDGETERWKEPRSWSSSIHSGLPAPGLAAAWNKQTPRVPVLGIFLPRTHSPTWCIISFLCWFWQVSARGCSSERHPMLWKDDPSQWQRSWILAWNVAWIGWVFGAKLFTLIKVQFTDLQNGNNLCLTQQGASK